MSQQFPVFGQPAPEPAEETAPVPFEEESPTGGRGLRSVLAGAAAITVLGGGALGFLWLSTPPTAETTAGTAGVRVTPPVAEPTSSPGIEGAGFAVSARDVFAPIVTPTTAAAGGSTGASTGASTGTTTGTSASTSTGSSGGSSGAVGGSAGSVGGSSGGTSTVTVTAPPSTTAAPVVPAPVPTTAKPVPVPVPTPTPSRSTAPSWVPSTYTYKKSADDAQVKTNFVIGATAIGSVDQRWAVWLDEGDKLYPAAITFQDDLGGSAWITSDRGVPQGWIVPDGSDVPAAAMGRTTGTVRVIGTRYEAHFLQVNRESSILLKSGDAVPGTPLTFKGENCSPAPAGTVCFADAAGVTYYGAFGAGETDGVSY